MFVNSLKYKKFKINATTFNKKNVISLVFLINVSENNNKEKRKAPFSLKRLLQRLSEAPIKAKDTFMFLLHEIVVVVSR